MKRKTVSLLLALALCAGLLAGCGGGAAKEGREEESGGGKTKRAQIGFAVDGYVLSRDDAYRYSYGDDGLCTRARGEAGDELRFSYEYDDAGRPAVRYVEADGERRVYEKYGYDAKGNLTVLSVYEDGGDEPSAVWEYDSRGRAVAGRGLPVGPPYAPGFMGTVLEDVEWDKADRLTSVTFPSDYTADMLLTALAGAGAGPEQREASRAALEDYLRENRLRDRDGLYRMESYTEKFEYDDAGRITKWVIEHEFTPLYAYVINHMPGETARNEDTLSFRYSKDEITISWSQRLYREGRWQKSGARGEFSYDVVRGADGLPVSVGGLAADIYDLLDCEVKSAEAGLFGITWQPGFINYCGELHGGFAGTDPANARSYLQAGLMQSLRVTGRGEDGEAITYVLWPDSFGRQRCEKFTDGLLTMGVSDRTDFSNRNTYVMNGDENERVYARLKDLG